MGFDPSPLCSILIGEIAYNLKAALDYLVFQLFYLATGEFNNSTKFLIVHSPDEWKRNFPQFDTPPKALKKLWLHRIRAEHQAVLKGLQPFSGTEWTKTLQEITNPDRHRQLIEVVGEIGYIQTGVIVPERPAADSVVIRPEMLVDFETTRKITFERGGRHAIDTMQHLAGEVAKVVDGFELDFQ